MAIVRMNNNSKVVLTKYGSDQYIAKLEAFLSQPKFNSFMADNMGKRNGWANKNEGYKVCLYGERDLIVIAFTSMAVPEGVAYSGLIADTMAQFEQAFRGKWQDAAEGAFNSKFKKKFSHSLIKIRLSHNIKHTIRITIEDLLGFYFSFLWYF